MCIYIYTLLWRAISYVHNMKSVAQSFVNRIFMDLVDEMKTTTKSFVAFPHSDDTEDINIRMKISYAREADELRQTKCAERFYCDVRYVLADTIIIIIIAVNNIHACVAIRIIRWRVSVNFYGGCEMWPELLVIVR